MHFTMLNWNLESLSNRKLFSSNSSIMCRWQGVFLLMGHVMDEAVISKTEAHINPCQCEHTNLRFKCQMYTTENKFLARKSPFDSLAVNSKRKVKWYCWWFGGNIWFSYFKVFFYSNFLQLSIFQVMLFSKKEECWFKSSPVFIIISVIKK